MTPPPPPRRMATHPPVGPGVAVQPTSVREPVQPENTAPAPAPLERRGPRLQVMLNGKMLELPDKEEGGPYYVMDLLEQSGVDFEHLDRGVELKVNGAECAFTQELRAQDDVVIRYMDM